MPTPAPTPEILTTLASEMWTRRNESPWLPADAVWRYAYMDYARLNVDAIEGMPVRQVAELMA